MTLKQSLLWPFTLPYGAAAHLRARAYRKGILKQQHLDGTVISVGNLTTGGTGKTPMVLAIAEHLLAEGKNVGILTRGAITVQVNVGAPVAEGPAYLRCIANGGIPAGKVGGIESNNDGNNSILLANVPSVGDAYFKNGVLDSNNLCELVLTSRSAA